VLSGKSLLIMFGSPFVVAYFTFALLTFGQMVDALCGPVGLVALMSAGDAADANPLGIVGRARLTGAVTGSAAT